MPARRVRQHHSAISNCWSVGRAAGGRRNSSSYRGAGSREPCCVCGTGRICTQSDSSGGPVARSAVAAVLRREYVMVPTILVILVLRRSSGRDRDGARELPDRLAGNLRIGPRTPPRSASGSSFGGSSVGLRRHVIFGLPDRGGDARQVRVLYHCRPDQEDRLSRREKRPISNDKRRSPRVPTL